MASYGIQGARVYGIRIPKLRQIARETGHDHTLAAALWASGIHEARILASMIEDPKQVSQEQMELWVAEFDSWDLCDQCCGNLFDRIPYAYTKALEWADREPEFIRRAGFALMAYLAVHDKEAPDQKFTYFLPQIEEKAGDSRNYVKKAVNWALRQIGKRSLELNQQAITLAQALAKDQDPTRRWVGRKALQELTSEKIQQKLKEKRNPL
jgi:3-methyladenine DNA glycosylase AlkD